MHLKALHFFSNFNSQFLLGFLHVNRQVVVDGTWLSGRCWRVSVAELIPITWPQTKHLIGRNKTFINHHHDRMQNISFWRVKENFCVFMESADISSFRFYSFVWFVSFQSVRFKITHTINVFHVDAYNGFGIELYNQVCLALPQNDCQFVTNTMWIYWTMFCWNYQNC